MKASELVLLRERSRISLSDLIFYTGYSIDFHFQLETGQLPILFDVEKRLLEAFGRHMLAQLGRESHDR